MSKRLKVGDVFAVPAKYVVNPDPPGWACVKASMDADEALREEGRREVMAEIAKLSPCNVSSCTFCCGSYEIQTDTWAHKPDCLWLRAQAVKA